MTRNFKMQMTFYIKCPSVCTAEGKSDLAPAVRKCVFGVNGSTSAAAAAAAASAAAAAGADAPAAAVRILIPRNDECEISAVCNK